MMIAECTFDRPDKKIPPLEHWQCLYAIKLQILQENIGLSFEEAQLYFHDILGTDIEYLEKKQNLEEGTPEYNIARLELNYKIQEIKERVGDSTKLFGRFQDGNWNMSGVPFDPNNPRDSLYKGEFDIDPIIYFDYQNLTYKSHKKKKTRVWYYGDPPTMEEFNRIRYAKRLWLLQEEGFSYKDARTYLHDERPETLDELSTTLYVSKEELESTYISTKKKVDDLMKTRDIFYSHSPIMSQSALRHT